MTLFIRYKEKTRLLSGFFSIFLADVLLVRVNGFTDDFDLAGFHPVFIDLDRPVRVLQHHEESMPDECLLHPNSN
jgi:hypothetical protein